MFWLDRPDPDFGRLKQAILRQGTPDRLPLCEVNIDDEVVSAILGERVRNPGYVNRLAQKTGEVNREEGARYVEQLTRVYYHLGYDYVILPTFLPMTTHTVLGQDTAGLARDTGRAWVDETQGPVSSWAEFEAYAWCRAEDIDFFAVEYAAGILPEAMGLMVRTRGVMEWLMRLLGFETLCFSLADDPDLVAAVSERIGTLVVEHVRDLSQLDGVSAIVLYDDMGFRTNTFVSPRDLRGYVLPWTKACAAAAHDHGLPFILHSCGNLEKIMDDLIDDVGIDAKHSFEDIIMPMPEVKARYGDRIGVLGGVDMHILAAGTEEEVRAATKESIESCAPGGGYAFGSGNTIANYVPLKNYSAMLDEARKVAWSMQ
jgi:uroporphyrinogen decarboxylase